MGDPILCACGCGGELRRAPFPSWQSNWVRGHQRASLEPAAIEKRFWAKVNKTDGCWLWTGSTRWFGHGALHVNGRRTLTHRYSWTLANGPIPDGQSVLHRCDTPACVRPDHLFLGTQTDNVADMVQKNRQARGPKPRRRVLMVAADGAGRAVRILRELTSSGRIIA